MHWTSCSNLRVVVLVTAIWCYNVLIFYFNNLGFITFWLVIKILLPLPATQVGNDWYRQLHRCMQAVMRNSSVLLCILTCIPTDWTSLD